MARHDSAENDAYDAGFDRALAIVAFDLEGLTDMDALRSYAALIRQHLGGVRYDPHPFPTDMPTTYRERIVMDALTDYPSIWDVIGKEGGRW